MVKFYTSVERTANDILYVGYDGKRRVVEKVRFQPTLFVPTRNKTKYRTLDGYTVDSIQPGSMMDCRDFIRETEADNFPIYGNRDYIAQFIGDKFPDVCIPDTSVMNISFIDIEVQSDQGFPEPSLAQQPITAITIKNNLDDTFYTWGIGGFESDNSIVQDKRIEYIRCQDEFVLLKSFLTHWQKNTPDIISGWNSEDFDMTYLINRVARVLGEDQLRKFSLFNIKPEARDTSYNIIGTTQLDFMKLFKKLGYNYGNQESYKLDNIANVVLGEKKLDYSEYSSLAALYRENHQKFIDYNIRDTQLVERMEDKTGFIALAMTLAHKANANYVTSFGSVKIWDTYIYNVLKKQNIVLNPQDEVNSDRRIEGAYVKEPQKGMHEWVCSFDLNSLYPHLIMQYNMSPETIMDGVLPGVDVESLLCHIDLNIPKDACVASTGQLFSTKSKGVFPQIVDSLYNERTIVKKKALEAKQLLENTAKDQVFERAQIEKDIARFDNEQMAVKILMNSLYGALSNKWFRYYDIRMAEAITISGQLTIRWAENTINEYLNRILKTNKVDYVIAIDTDSLYVRMGELVKQVMPNETDQDKICKFIDKVSEQKIEPLLEKTYKNLKEYVHAYDQRMHMKREIIASKVIFTGKKRYIANVLNNEGVQYAKPKIKITGIESVRSSTPQVCRKLIEKTLSLIMNKDEFAVQKFIETARGEFQKLNPEDVAFPRGVSNIWKQQKEGVGVPIHVRASRRYNQLIKELNINNKYEEIKNGDKVKFTYLKMPNPAKQNVIAFPIVLPSEFDLNRFIDYDMQFDKSYVEPIKNILDAIGWSVERTNTLEDFFNG
jgi:DNA polymerase elongation subunit (family B)